MRYSNEYYEELNEILDRFGVPSNDYETREKAEWEGLRALQGEWRDVVVKFLEWAGYKPGEENGE